MAVKILSIGGGWVVNHRHLPALKLNPGFELAGIVSDNEQRTRETARRFGVPHFAANIDFSADWQASADAVIIGTIPHAHYEIAKQSLLAGKHVLTEKPMTLTVEQGQELAALAKEKKLVMAVVHNFQFSGAAKKYQHDLARGRIGKIQAAYGVQLCNHRRNIPAWCDKLPLGLFFDESPHFYYLFRWLSGGQCSFLNATVWKSREHRNTPRLVTAEYRACSNASEQAGDDFPVYLHINFESSLTEWHVTVVGENGTADIDVWRDIYVYLPNDGVHAARDIVRTSLLATVRHWQGVLTGGIQYFRGRHLYGNLEVQNRFLQAIRGNDSLQGMSAEEGIQVVAMQHELVNRAVYYD
ncbi:MAG: Gfo/Idh/MocA family oxidoreductase [Kiritimatiellae bacterium]|jgi:predicted dehydrogenase|nr:Gfo/Idh/MocA family oxidoreductase [Kiritimatiellia bacterium]